MFDPVRPEQLGTKLTNTARRISQESLDDSTEGVQPWLVGVFKQHNAAHISGCTAESVGQNGTSQEQAGEFVTRGDASLAESSNFMPWEQGVLGPVA